MGSSLTCSSTTFELNKDSTGVRIDGVQCITKTDLYGMIERIYQKEENLVRKEWKVTADVSVNKFEEAISRRALATWIVLNQVSN